MTPPSVPLPADGPSGAGTAVLDPGARLLRRPRGSILADRVYVAVTAGVCLVAVAGIGYLIYATAAQTGPVWKTFGVWGFIAGTEWVPTPADGGEGIFGALPFIYGTVVTSLIAMALAVPAAIGIALATTVFLPRRVRAPIATTVDLLAAVPSVIFGLWGVTVVVPLARPILEGMADVLGGVSVAGWRPFEGPVTAGSYLLAGLVLGIMVLPIITAISREVLATVPADQQEAAYALGATKWEMVRHSMLPWARSGIVGASALGLGRAVGETIAIAMLLGNSPGIFDSLLGPGSTLAGVIALETGEAGDLQLSALTALAIILFLLAFAINALARALVRRTAAGPGPVRRRVADAVAHLAPPKGRTVVGGAADAQTPLPDAQTPLPDAASCGAAPIARRRRVESFAAEGVIYLSLVIGLASLSAVLGEMLVKGAPALSVEFFTELPPLDPSSYDGGIQNAIVGTLVLTGIAAAVAAPLGVLAALFVSEWATSGTPILGRVASGIGFFVDILLGAPSVVVGLTVYLGIVIVQGHFSALAGGIALGIIMFPIVVRSANEVLRLVPEGHREAALALGAPRWRLMWSVVLPAAAPGILTGIMLGIARAAGETAPLIFTALGGGNIPTSTDIFQPIAAIPKLIFDNTIMTQTPASLQLAWGAALVLVSVILLLSLGARLVSWRAGGSQRP